MRVSKTVYIMAMFPDGICNHFELISTNELSTVPTILPSNSLTTIPPNTPTDNPFDNPTNDPT